MADLAALADTYGIQLPSLAYVIGVLLFGVIGLVVYVKGRRAKKRAVRWLGIALMFYPYVVWGTLAMYVVGVLLTGTAWWAWRQAP